MRCFWKRAEPKLDEEVEELFKRIADAEGALAALWKENNELRLQLADERYKVTVLNGKLAESPTRSDIWKRKYEAVKATNKFLLDLVREASERCESTIIAETNVNVNKGWSRG